MAYGVRLHMGHTVPVSIIRNRTIQCLTRITRIGLGTSMTPAIAHLSTSVSHSLQELVTWGLLHRLGMSCTDHKLTLVLPKSYGP